MSVGTRVVMQRLTEDTVERLDRLTKKIRNEQRGVMISRAAVIRKLVLEGLDRAEKEK